jgi:hypothetical protein
MMCPATHAAANPAETAKEEKTDSQFAFSLRRSILCWAFRAVSPRAEKRIPKRETSGSRTGGAVRVSTCTLLLNVSATTRLGELAEVHPVFSERRYGLPPGAVLHHSMLARQGNVDISQTVYRHGGFGLAEGKSDFGLRGAQGVETEQLFLPAAEDIQKTIRVEEEIVDPAHATLFQSRGDRLFDLPLSSPLGFHHHDLIADSDVQMAFIRDRDRRDLLVFRHLLGEGDVL